MSHHELPGGWSLVAARQRHHAGDHTACRPAWCLAARADAGTPAAPATRPATSTCVICDGPIEHVTREVFPGHLRGGWRHLTAEPGEPHTAYPAEGGERS